CDPKLVASNTKEVLHKEASIKAMVDELPTNLKVTKVWIKNHKNRCCLIAVKIPHKNNNNEGNIEYNADDDNNNNNNNNNIQPEQENIKISNPKNPKQQIIFQYSKEKHIYLPLTSNEIINNHWAAR